MNQQNSGVSAARNNGLAHAKGDYVWFVDSDDFIKENVLLNLIIFMDKNPSDCYTPDFCNVDERTDLQQLAGSTTKFKRIEHSQWRQGRHYSYTWLHIISRKFLLSHNIKFKVGVTHQEDTLWVFWLNIFKCTYCYTDEIIYAYRQRATSAMHNWDKQDYLDSMIALTDTYKDVLDKFCDKLSLDECDKIKIRIQQSVQNELFCSMLMDKQVRMQILQTLIADGLYPYPILWSRLSVRYGIKNLLINLVGLFIPCKLYYYSMGYIFDIIRKIKCIRNNQK